jgi:hypothetical protein
MLTILYALLSLAIAVGVIYLILWVLGMLGLAIPPNIVKVVWVILLLLAVIWIFQHFLTGYFH